MYRSLQNAFMAKAKAEFGIVPLDYGTMDAVVRECEGAYTGRPSWLSEDDHITTTTFAATICQEYARLTTLAIGISLDGSARADWLQEKIDGLYFKLREWVEYSCAYGTVILKTDGDTVACLTPNQFIVTDQDNGKITGAVFKDEAKDGDTYYTRLEYQRFEEEQYVITNAVYASNTPNAIGDRVPIENSPWAQLQDEVRLVNVTEPLFAVLKTPSANNVEINSPMGMPAFYPALEELKALDIAYSRNIKEIIDSKRTVLIDSDKLMVSGAPVRSASDLTGRVKAFGLPDFVKTVMGSSTEGVYQEINPTLNTETRLAGINSLLSQIGFKCGFSNGYFVFNEKTGMMTATQVEADDRRTIQTIKDMRDKLESCLDSLIYCLDVFATLYGYAPEGDYEVTYDFGDIDYNLEEDRARWWGYAMANAIPKWLYFVKFEGMTEEEAKAMTEEAQPSEPPLFGEE
jgi:A118 family predicted phage portal protein